LPPTLRNASAGNSGAGRWRPHSGGSGLYSAGSGYCGSVPGGWGWGWWAEWGERGEGWGGGENNTGVWSLDNVTDIHALIRRELELDDSEEESSEEDDF